MFVRVLMSSRSLLLRVLAHICRLSISLLLAAELLVLLQSNIPEARSIEAITATNKTSTRVTALFEFKIICKFLRVFIEF